MPNKVLVIGSNAFAATYFTQVALENGCQVLGISRSSFPAPYFVPFSSKSSVKQFTFQQLDINQDFNEITQHIHNFKPDTVANFAAQGMVAQSWDKPLDWYQTNIVSSVRLVEYLKQSDYLDRFLQISTPEVYGSQQQPITPKHQYAPSTPYALSKACLDDHLRLSCLHQDFPALFVRSANFYGPTQQLYRVVPKAFLCFLTGKTFYLQGGGNSIRSFIHARDAAEGFYKALTQGTIGGIYHLATDEMIQIKVLVQSIAQLCNRNLETAIQHSPDRLAQDPCYHLDTQSSKQQLGWSPKISLSQGLAETYKWITQNLPQLEQLNWAYQHKA